MNIIASQTQPVNNALLEQMAPPVTTPITHIAYLWGLEDAQAGNVCVPEMLFASRIQQIAYCTGYERITGPTRTTRQILWGK